MVLASRVYLSNGGMGTGAVKIGVEGEVGTGKKTV